MSIRNRILTDGGITVKSRTMLPVSPKRGYAVGQTKDTAIILPDTATDTDIHRAMFLVWLQYGTRHIGAWHDQGLIHVDPSTIVQSKRDAIALARENRQMAIYGFAKRDTIRI
jgi:hypothetical protein